MSNFIPKIMLVALSVTLFFAFTSNNISDKDPKSKALVEALFKVNGGWEKLASKKDVEFTYTYHDLAKGKDISTERYIFNGDASWGEYSQHEVNVMPNKKGTVAQCLVNGKPAISFEGQPITDEQAIGGTAFLRSANFFWFTMMYKLNDPGTIHKYLGQENVNGIKYDKVSLSYNSSVTNKEANDEFVLYFNPKTSLVDQLMFSVPAMGINQPILKMGIEYTAIDGIQVPSKRTVSIPDAEGNYSVGTIQYTTGVKFNNNFTASDLGIQDKETESLMAADRAWAKAATPEAFMSFIRSDALMMAPDKGIAKGHEAIGKLVSEFQSYPGFQITFEPQEAFVSQSGDLGYTVDRILVNFNDENGKKVNLFEKGITIWKKDANGDWKLAVDIWNVDPTISSIFN